MKKKRIEQLEKNITGIDPKYWDLMELYDSFSKAPQNEKVKLREQADQYLEQVSKLRYFPPNDADVTGMVSLHEWHEFVQYNFN